MSRDRDGGWWEVVFVNLSPNCTGDRQKGGALIGLCGVMLCVTCAVYQQLSKSAHHHTFFFARMVDFSRGGNLSQRIL